MHTSLVDEKTLMSKTRRVCEDVESICRSGASLSQHGMYRDPVQTLLLRRGMKTDSLILPIVEAAAIQAEKSAAGAGELFLRIFSSSFPVEIMRNVSNLEPDDEWNQLLESTRTSSIPARKSDLERLFSKTGEIHGTIMKDVFQNLMSNDKVLVRKISTAKTSITRETGYTFEGLGIDPRFFSRGSWIKKDVRMVLIDGVIENISEIHVLLEELSKTRSPCVIFCIDALPDISETIIKNFLSGSLDVILAKVPVIEMHINTMADIGIIAEAEPVSHQIGETISMGVKRQQSKADKITITKTQINIERKSSKLAVSKHVRELRRRLDENIELSIILEPRIRSLNSSTLKIDVGIEDLRKDPNIVEKLDRTFRSLPKIIKSGFIEKSDFKEFSYDKICLIFEQDDVVPAEMAQQAIKIFLSTRKAIQSASVGIISV